MKINVVRNLSCIAILSLIQLCSFPVRAQNTNIQLPPSGPVATTGSITGCVITVDDAFFWRDWMPTVSMDTVPSNKSNDGGKPLYVSVSLKLDNLKGPQKQLSWEAFILAEDNTIYPLNLVDETGKPGWTGIIEAGETKNVKLMSHNGPYIAVGTKMEVFIRFTDQDHAQTWVKTASLEIVKTE